MPTFRKKLILDGDYNSRKKSFSRFLLKYFTEMKRNATLLVPLYIVLIPQKMVANFWDYD